MTDRRVTFLVNPSSAGGKTARFWKKREQELRVAFPFAEVQFTQARRDATELARVAQARGQELVVAVGGDGTVHEVVNGLMADASRTAEQRSALAILPSGTGSDFARSLDVGSNFDQALTTLREGKSAWVDLGRVTAPDGDSRAEWFNNVASFGVTGDVVARIQRSRKWLGTKPTYLWAAVATLLRYRNAPVTLQFDREPSFDCKLKAVAVGNGRYFGGGMCIAPDARLQTNRFQAVVVGDLGRLVAVKRLGETYGGQRIDHPLVEYRDCQQLLATTTSGRKIGVELDGEAWGELPARFEVVPRCLRVVVGAQAAIG